MKDFIWILHLLNNFHKNIEIKRHSQPSLLSFLFTWDNQTYDYTGTERELFINAFKFCYFFATCICHLFLNCLFLILVWSTADLIFDKAATCCQILNEWGRLKLDSKLDLKYTYNNTFHKYRSHISSSLQLSLENLNLLKSLSVKRQASVWLGFI